MDTLPQTDDAKNTRFQFQQMWKKRERFLYLGYFCNINFQKTEAPVSYFLGLFS